MVSKNLKSGQEDLRRRGMATKEYIALMTRYSQGECRRLLHAEEARRSLKLILLRRKCDGCI